MADLFFRTVDFQERREAYIFCRAKQMEKLFRLEAVGFKKGAGLLSRVELGAGKTLSNSKTWIEARTVLTIVCEYLIDYHISVPVRSISGREQKVNCYLWTTFHEIHEYLVHERLAALGHAQNNRLLQGQVLSRLQLFMGPHQTRQELIMDQHVGVMLPLEWNCLPPGILLFFVMVNGS